MNPLSLENSVRHGTLIWRTLHTPKDFVMTNLLPLPTTTRCSNNKLGISSSAANLSCGPRSSWATIFTVVNLSIRYCLFFGPILFSNPLGRLSPPPFLSLRILTTFRSQSKHSFRLISLLNSSNYWRRSSSSSRHSATTKICRICSC